MKKISVLFIATFFLIIPFMSKAYSGDIQMQVKGFECVQDGKIVVHYALVNTYGHDYNTVSLCFKLIEADKPLACKELKTTVPKDADGSKTEDLTMEIPCSNKDLSLQSTVFYNTKRYRIEEWFSDCK